MSGKIEILQKTIKNIQAMNETLTQENRELDRMNLNLEKQAARYEKIRKMNTYDFIKIYGANIGGEGTFDELVDRWEEKL